MDTHVKIVGWMWIVSGLVGTFLLAIGLLIFSALDICPDPDDFFYVTLGALCLFLPGIIVDFVSGIGLLRFQNWARILAILLSIFNLVFLWYLVIPALMGIYTLVIMFNREAKALFQGGGSE